MANEGRKLVREPYFLAYDAGGTMTDCVIVDSDGNVALGKSLTDYHDESESFLESTQDASADGGHDIKTVLAGSEAVIYAGTIMLNTILSYAGQRVGMIVSRGMEDYLTQQRGEGSWLGLSYADRLHSVTHYNKDPYVARERVMGITERIDGFGNIVIPLREEELRQKVAQLIGLGSEVIGIVFLYSALNPVHEQRAKAIAAEVIAEHGSDIPLVVSSELAPTLKEYTRLTSVVIQAYAAEPSREQFRRVQESARANGFSHEVQTLLAHGGVANISHPRLYESFVAGPTGGILGAKFIGELLGLENVVATDVGGTSFDVGIIRGGIIPVQREPVVLHNRISLPMVETVSIGAGTGSELVLNPVSGRLNIGPKSAGASAGLCFRHPRLTVTDVNVALGYLNPDYFLGGSVRLDPERATQGVKALAAEFGKDADEFGAGVLEVLHESFRQHLTAMVLGRGHSASDYTLFAYGGGGPMHLSGICQGMGFEKVLTFPFAAVFSAFGILTTDRIHRYHQAVVAAVPPGGDPVSTGIKQAALGSLKAGFAQLRERALTDVVKGDVAEDAVAFQYYAYVRYANQIYDFEVPLSSERFDELSDLDRLVAEFEGVYGTLYPAAARHPEAGYLVMELALTAAVASPRPALPRFALEDKIPDEARKPGRRAYCEGEWMPFDIYEMERLKAGNVVRGPAVIEDPATTLILPPDRQARFDEHRFIWYEQRT
jgi:acetone carboxylase beta subunit